MNLAQMRKAAKKTVRNAVALRAFAPLRESFAVVIALLVLLSFLGAQTRRQPPAPAPQSILLTSVKNEKMAAAFHSGQLPEAMRKPDGKPDEVAAALAKRVAAGDDQSVPALVTALMTAGFGIRDSDGGVTQTVQPGQGLVFDAWEVAAMAKMYGERRTVTLPYLSDTIRTIPELKQAPLEKILIDGIRKQAVSDQPELRFWARFIVELGRQSQQRYDLLAGGDKKAIRIDAIQHALILRRMLGDIYTLSQRSEQALRRVPKPAYAHASQTQPCTLSDMEATIADIRATAMTSAFGELMSWVKETIQGSAGKLFEAYGKFANIANILLAYAKFIATYAGLETEITVDNPPLVRNTTVSAGQRRQLTAKVKMNIGKAQQVNCFRWLLNAGTGLDFNLMNDGPLPGVEVNWHLVSGGAADFYDSGDRSQQIVWFTGTGPRIQDAGTYAGASGKPGIAVGNLTKTKTDDQGNARILLEGASRRNHVPSPHIPVMKTAVVMTTVKLKGGDLKGDAVDIVGHVSGGIISLAKKEGLGGASGGMFTLPLELLYRTDWASTATIEVPVKDWETCESDAWQGTITYTKEFNHTQSNSGPKGHDETVQKELVTATFDLRGQERISQSGVINVLNANVQMNASYNETYNSKGTAACTRPLQRTTELSGESQSSGSVGVQMTPDNRYRVNYQVPTLSVEGYHVTSWHLEGDCKNPFMSKSGGSKTLMSRIVEPARLDIEGAVDPKNPHVLTGTKTETIERNGGTMTITVTWNLTRCRTM